MNFKDDLYEPELNFIKKTVSENFPFNPDNYGKMIRSKLGILVLKSLNIKIDERYLKFLSVIELIHNASLFHDDIIDNQTQRRGVNTCIDTKTSLLYGNIIMTNAFNILINLSSLELLSLMTATVSDMCRGELLQQGQMYKIPLFDEYMEKTFLKTGKLFSSIFVGVNILANNNLPLMLEEFFRNFGIAYQIKNDLDNILSDKSDLKNGIYTLPVIYSGSTNLTKDSIEKTIFLIDNYKSRGVNILSNLEDSPYKEEMIRIVECLKN